MDLFMTYFLTIKVFLPFSFLVPSSSAIFSYWLHLL